MSGPFENVCRLLLKNFFEETNIVKVGEYLLRRGTCSFFNIKTGTGMSVWDVKRSLAVLIQHSLVTFEANVKNPNIAEYKLCKYNVYCILKYPNSLHMINKIYGSSEEVLIEILLNIGQASASDLIFQSANKLNEAIVLNPSDLYQSFKKLAADKFIIRCAKIEEFANVQKVPKLLELDEKEKFIVPQLEMEPIAKLLREKATELGEHSDSEIIWRVNHQRFDVELRNVILVNAAARRVDETAGELYHLILKLWRDASPPEALNTNGVSHILIKEAVMKNDGSSPMLMEHFDQYLKVLCEDSTGLISRISDSDGGLFAVNYADVFENLACTILDSIVLEKFGLHALRIFRLTRMQKSVDQDQMQMLAAIPEEEANRLSSKLMKENFLKIKELKKGTSNVGPVKFFNLFHVDLPEVVHRVLQTSYKCISNAMERQQHDLTANKRLLERHASIENSLERLRGEEAPDYLLAKISDSMTAAEKELVAKIHKLSFNLTLARIETNETVLILESYLKFYSMQSKMIPEVEREVLGLIEEAGNKGIWTKDIQKKSRSKKLKKVLEALEEKNLIKSVSSVLDSKNNLYMLFNLEPTKSITDWYNLEYEFESEVVNLLYHLCCGKLLQKTEEAKLKKNEGPVVVRNSSFLSSQEICQVISDMEILRFNLTVENIETILDALVFDGKVEKSTTSDGNCNGQVKMYRTVVQPLPFASITRNPCGVCPVMKNCGNVGEVQPKNCKYFNDWI